MSFNIQDDAGTVEGANAYASVQAFKDYWADRGGDYSAKTDEEIQAWIVQATQYIDIRFTYYGTPLAGRGQTTEFPRENLYDENDNLVEGMPREVVSACLEYAKVAITNPLTTDMAGNASNISEKSEKVGPITKAVKYTGGSAMGSGTFSVYQIADNLLKRSGFVSSIGKVPIRG